ncbi:DUF6458 family protein [Kineococcus sp. LSe6-4]|uniref:DUF6458 family protein n=1 Tax=Kineococcus halophytocola TaxID=3234027 RepID=A0ABV4GWI7_9ACTN
MHLTNHSFAFTVGAVLAFAVHVDLAVVDLTAVGWILMLVALVSTLLEVVGRSVRTRALRAGSGPQPVPARALSPARVPPPVASWDTRAFRAVPRPAGES